MEVTLVGYDAGAAIAVPGEAPPFCQELQERGLWPTTDLPAALLQLLDGDENPTAETSWCSRLCALTEEELSRSEFDEFFRELGHELEYFPRQTLWKMTVAFRTRFVSELRRWGDETVSARLCLER